MQPDPTMRAQLVAALTRLIGLDVSLSLEAADGGDLAVRGVLVSALDRPSAPGEGNLTVLIGPHLLELSFGQLEHLHIEFPPNGDRAALRIRLLLEGTSVLELRASPH